MTAAAVDRKFQHLAPTQADEDAYDYTKFREGVHPTSLAGSIGHLVKGALGAGILSGHVAYSKGGIYIALPVNIIAGIYMGICLYFLVRSVQILLKRTRRPFMSYADAGEAAMMLFPKKGVAKFAPAFRYCIDAVITVDLYGSCCCYQLIIAKSMKQLVENNLETSLKGIAPGYPNLRIYVLIFLPLLMLVCLIRHLKYLAPFSMVGNVIIAFCVAMSIYYCFVFNPTLSGMKKYSDMDGFLQYMGMQVFSMSCCGLVIPVESNMKDPTKFGAALAVGMFFIICFTLFISFFGYAAFLEASTAPITVNFPMTTIAKCFKASIMVMMVTTHAVNFWVPFNLCWYYLKYKHNPARIVMWERIWRAFFVFLIGMVAVTFPSIVALMGFIGSLCITNMAFTFPCIIYLLTMYERPGYGAFKWRFWVCLVFLIVGLFILFCATYVNFGKMVDVFTINVEV